MKKSSNEQIMNIDKPTALENGKLLSEEGSAEENITSEEGKTLRLGKRWKAIFVVSTCLAIAYSINEVFQLGLVFHEFVYLYFVLAVFLSFSFIIFPASKKASHQTVPWYDIFLSLVTVCCCAYIIFNAFRISDEGWVMVGPPLSIIVSILLWLLALEALRRSGGLVLFLVVVLFSVYPLFAEHMPGFMEGAGWSFSGAAKYHVMTRESLIGIPMRTFCQIVIGFMIFSSTLKVTGGGLFFTKVATSLLGGVRGGPAKVSVFASSLFGTISGSAVANVAVDGWITIPAMKKTGYSAEYAAAIEACSSTGGCIMPPVMGAVAFVMASFLEVPYREVAIAAIVPAALYYLGLFVQVDCHAAKAGLKGLPKNELPSLKRTLKEGWIYFAALVGLVYLIFRLKQEAQAPYFASLLLLIGACFKKETRPNLKTLYDLALDSGKVLVEMVSLLAGIGFILGGLSMTGVTISFSSELVNLLGKNPLVMLLMGAVVSYILGMGMTSTACYIMLAIVLVPALAPLGFDPMAIHLFVLYCGLFSFITPPVALAAYVAAIIGGANFWKTGFRAMRLCFVLYFIPFFFVYNPALILHGKSTLTTIEIIMTSFIGVFILASAIEGYFYKIGKEGPINRVIFFIAGMLLFIPERITSLIGVLMVVGMYVFILMYRRFRKHGLNIIARS